MWRRPWAKALRRPSLGGLRCRRPSFVLRPKGRFGHSSEGPSSFARRASSAPSIPAHMLMEDDGAPESGVQQNQAKTPRIFVIGRYGEQKYTVLKKEGLIIDQPFRGGERRPRRPIGGLDVPQLAVLVRSVVFPRCPSCPFRSSRGSEFSWALRLLERTPTSLPASVPKGALLSFELANSDRRARPVFPRGPAPDPLLLRG